MSRHEGVSCDSCLKSNFTGRRFKCLICFDYDLCADCYEDGVTSPRHQHDHPMQCILTRADMELCFGGEILTSDLPQSFTCPFCRKMGYSDATLLEHVSTEHTETSLEVVCPICAGMPGGEPNLVTDDFAGHLTLEHRQGPRDLYDEPSAIRHGGGVRRIPGRTLGGPRPRRSNTHFMHSTGLSPSGRDPVDPIAELLSQLSGVRRGGANLQQLQMQMQVDRHQVTGSAPRQLDRMPRRAPPIVAGSHQNAMAELVNGGSGSGSGGSSAMSVFLGGGGGGSSGLSAANVLASSTRNGDWIVTASTSSSVTSQHVQSSNLAANSFTARDSVINANPLAITVSGNNGSGVGVNANVGSSSTTAASANVASNNSNEGQQQFLLAKFMQPTLSDAEQAELERNRADRAQFVQALLLSALCSEKLSVPAETNDNETNTIASQQQRRDASTTADGSYKPVQQSQQDDPLANNNAAAGAIQSFNDIAVAAPQHNANNNAAVLRVNQMQQTTPEEDEHNINRIQALPQQQQHQLTQTNNSGNNYTRRKPALQARPAAVAPTLLSTTATAERRGRPPPPPPVGAAAPSTSNATAQHNSKYKQQHSSSSPAAAANNTNTTTTMATVNPMPDTR